jgi:hypothetical protein
MHPFEPGGQRNGARARRAVRAELQPELLRSAFLALGVEHAGDDRKCRLGALRVVDDDDRAVVVRKERV